MSFLKEVLITCAHCKHEYVVKEPISCETNLIDNPIYASAL